MTDTVVIDGVGEFFSPTTFLADQDDGSNQASAGDPVYATAVANARAAFPGVAGATLVGAGVGGLNSLEVVHPGDYSAAVSSVVCTPYVVSLSTFASRSVDFYFAATDPDSSPGAGSTPQFDANGTGLVKDHYHGVTSVGIGTASPVTGATIDNPAHVPNSPTGGSGAVPVVRGYKIVHGFAVIHWVVAGGFAYHA
jgi:hypothetical protein